MQVQKKDGSLEEFDRSKVSGGVVKAGATLDQAETIATQVEAWARESAVDGIIRANEVRTKVLELLRATNPEAGATFEAYKKPVADSPGQEAQPEG